jgi:threonine dehydratase
MVASPLPTLADIQAAHERIRVQVHRTPVMTSQSIDAILGAELFFKCENLQKVGAFKFRGASNAVGSLSPEQLSRGVATHSSGNHAAALALAAKMRGAKAYVVMPENSPVVKVEAVRGYGADIRFCVPTLQAREDGLAAVVDETGAEFVHPYNDARVVCGQGTAALELLEQTEKLDVVMTPVGGGGLLSGTATAIKELAPEIQVFGAEPEMADDAFRSFKAGKLIPQTDPRTIADGLRTSLGELTFAIISRKVDRIFTCSEESIVVAMRLIWERMKILIEPSSAVPLATLLEKKFDFKGKRIGIVLSGGNVDLKKLPF